MLQRCADRFERFVLIGSSPHQPADRPRAQSDARDVRLQTVHFCIFHNTGPASECFLIFFWRRFRHVGSPSKTTTKTPSSLSFSSTRPRSTAVFRIPSLSNQLTATSSPF